MSNIDQDFRGNTAQVRRLSDHLRNGGQLRQHDIDYCVEACESKDATIEKLQSEVEYLQEQLMSEETMCCGGNCGCSS